MESEPNADSQSWKPEILSYVKEVETPAFVIDQRVVAQSLQIVDQIKVVSGCKLLYALKPFVNADVLRQMAPHLDGFAASSLYEAMLSRSILGDRGTVHITTPGLHPDEICRVGEVCDYVVFNSLSQAERFLPHLVSTTNCGLRINPQYSFVNDERYNPCRESSKLGVPFDQIKRALKQNRGTLPGIRGLHFHTNCDATSFKPLVQTVRYVMEELDDLVKQMEWINLGGGYLFTRPLRLDRLYEAIHLLRSHYSGLEVLIEPGAALVREAGYFVASVIDLFKSDGRTIAVLDTTVNHMPEVFEYQFQMDVIGDKEEGKHVYLFAGGTCLAGDLFGEYAFDTPMQIGSRVVFTDAGAYTHVKAHMFNGINLPTIYTITEAGELALQKRFTYQDFLSKYGAESHVIV